MRTNEPAIAAYLDAALRRMSIGREVPANVAGIDRGAILWGSGGAELWLDGRPITFDRKPSGPLEAAFCGSAALLGKSLRRLERQRGLYAAGMSRGDACVAIIAPSGTGKTTLALELLRRGWSTYGDEFLVIDRATLVAEAVPLAFMVRESALDSLDDFALAQRVRDGAIVDEKSGIRTWHGFDVADEFGAAAIAAPRPLTHVVLLERSRDGFASYERISAAALALELLPRLFIENLQVADIWETAAALRRVACYRLCAGDHRVAADALAKLVVA